MGRAKPLAEQQRRALDRLSRVPEIARYYLAGGTAVAVQLEHRQSRDLDLFSRERDVELETLKDSLDEAFDMVVVVRETDAALHLLCDGVPMDFVRYPYPPLLEPTDTGLGVRVASLVDLGVMKLSAIAKRGLRRDFWDLVAILDSGISLRELGSAYSKRFGVRMSDLYHVARALTYFGDAEKDPAMPAGMNEDLWHGIQARMRAEAPALIADADG